MSWTSSEKAENIELGGYGFVLYTHGNAYPDIFSLGFRIVEKTASEFHLTKFTHCYIMDDTRL
jgi:hypothetical protein